MYYITSTLWPAQETYLDAAILADDVVAESESEDMEKTSLDKTAVHADAKSTLSERGP